MFFFWRDIVSNRFALSGPRSLLFWFWLALPIMFSLSSATAAFSPVPGSQAAAARARAESLTQSLLQIQDRHQRASPAEKPQLIPEFSSVAAQRRQALAALIENYPAEVLKLAIPPGIWARLPAEVRSQVESHVDLQGELTVLYEDYKDRARLRHLLLANGRRYNLHFSGRPPNLLSGTKVRVKAVQLESELVLESGTPTAGATTLMEVITPALGNTFGNFQTAVLLVNFQDNATQPYSVSQVWNVVFGTSVNSANDYFREVSFQQTSLSGNVFGWYALPIPSTCDNYQIASAANSAASAAGVNLSAYQRLIYAFPATSICGWSGKGTVGGTPASAWINGALNNAQVVTHEMGHNFGLYHSHALECGTTAIGSNCTNQEYGDWLDTMGNTNAGHYNAFQKERLGWLNYGTSPPIATVQLGGSFALDAYESAGSGTKALKVLKGTDASTGQKSWYYVEYRRALGFDAFLSGNSNVLNGVLIHSARDGQPDSSNLLDTTPASSIYNFQDWADVALTTGQSFTDATAGVTITTTSAGGSSAGVSVTSGTASCVHASPDLALSPLQGATVAPGTPVTYTVTVTNNDSGACSTSQFNLSATVPSGWNGLLGSASLGLAPGSRGTTPLTVTAPASTPAGIYSLSAAIASSTTATASYVVGASTSLNQPPVAVNDSASTLRNTPVRVAVLANDRDPEGAPLSITATTPAAHGTVAVNADGSITYTPQSNFKGSDSFGYTVSDGSQTASATVSVQIKQR